MHPSRQLNHGGMWSDQETPKSEAAGGELSQQPGVLFSSPRVQGYFACFDNLKLNQVTFDANSAKQHVSVLSTANAVKGTQLLKPVCVFSVLFKSPPQLLPSHFEA